MSKRTMGMGALGVALLAAGGLWQAGLLPGGRLGGHGAGWNTGYAVGFSSAHGLRSLGPIPVSAFAQGLEDGLSGTPRQGVDMARPEFTARMRDVLRRMAEAQAAAVAAEIGGEAEL